MTDSIKIIITKSDIVVDTSVAVLGLGPGGVPLIDLVEAAFADAYGVHAVPDPDDPDADNIPVTLHKNVSYQLRQFVTNITLAYAGKQIDAAATTQKEATKAAALAALTIADA